MYVIPEVDEDDYISDPNMSRIKDRKLDSDAENPKVDTIFETKAENEDEPDSKISSPQKTRPKST